MTIYLKTECMNHQMYLASENDFTESGLSAFWRTWFFTFAAMFNLIIMLRQ